MAVFTWVTVSRLFCCCLLLLVVQFCNCLGEYTRRFEIGKNDENSLAKGKVKYEELQRESEYSPCWRDALSTLDTTCRNMTDSTQRRLALALTNCHFENSGRETYPCARDMNVKDCISKDIMGDSSFQIFTQFYTHANNLCYYLQSQLWQEQTETTINRLSDTSHETVQKLEQSLDYHREMEVRQSQALQNQAVIIEQDSQIAKSLEDTKLNMDRAFQEMSEKAEEQKFALENMLTKLNKGMANIQWLLSLMLGEFITLETSGFFIVVAFVVTFAPQFGYSRVCLYVTIIVYWAVESVVKSLVLWWTNSDPPDVSMATLHSVLWYTRWLCVITMSAVYVWCWQADTRYVREQLKLLRDVSSKIDKLSNYSVSTRKQRIPKATSIRKVMADGSDEEDNGIETCNLPSPLSSGNHIQPDDIFSGKQLLDFLSGLYIKENAQRYLVDHDDNSLNSFNSDSDTTYRQPSAISITSTITSTTTQLDVHPNNNATLTRIPLPTCSSNHGNIPALAVQPTCQTRLLTVNTSKIEQTSPSPNDHGYTPEKEVMEEKIEQRRQQKLGRSALSPQGRARRPRSRSGTPSVQATNKHLCASSTSRPNRYNLRSQSREPPHHF